MNPAKESIHIPFMTEALKEAQLAFDDGEFPVGCVFVQKGGIIARGRRQNSSAENSNEIDHAEVTTLRKLVRENPGLDMAEISVYSTMEPCLMCYSTMLLSGIRTYIWAYEDVMGGGMNLPLYMLNTLYARMKVTMVDSIMRKESLQMFQAFFQQHSYWQDSLLSRYTLAQKIEE